jgi:hypothetical protein
MMYQSPEMQRSFQFGFLWQHHYRKLMVLLSNRCVENDWITVPSNELGYYQ